MTTSDMPHRSAPVRTIPAEGGQRFVPTAQAAGYLGLSPRTLEKLRVRGGGPTYAKFGRRVVYAVEDLDHWAAERRRDSTSAPERPGRR
jgi:hypothetical protein